MVFCISSQFFHPNWDADIDYDAIVLRSSNVVLLTTSPYDGMFSYEPVKIYRISPADYHYLDGLDFGLQETNDSLTLEVVYRGDYPKNILNDTSKNLGEFMKAGQSYFAQNPLRELLLDTIKNNVELSQGDRYELMNWLNNLN